MCARYKSALPAPIARVYHRIVPYALDSLLLDSRKHFSCLSPSHHADSSGNASPEQGGGAQSPPGDNTPNLEHLKKDKKVTPELQMGQKVF